MSAFIRRIVLSVTAAGCLLFVPASSAVANTDLCVGSGLGCDVAHTWTFNFAGLQAALSTAGSNGVGGDTLRIAAGEIVINSGLSYTAASGDPLQIVGSGVSQTTLRPNVAGMTMLALDLRNAPSGGVSGLKLAGYAGTESGFPRALDLRAGTAASIDVNDAPNSSSSGDINLGANLQDGARLVDSSVHLAGSVTYGVQLLSGSAVERSSIIGTGMSNDQYGAYIDSAADLSHLTLKGLGVGLLPQQTLSISDSLIDLGSLSAAVGISAAAIISPKSLGVRNVTIAGSGSGQHAIDAYASSAGKLNVALTDSIAQLSGAGSMLNGCTVSGAGSEGKFSLTRVLYDRTRFTTAGGCTLVDDQAFDYAAAPPVFADAAAGDYRLAPGSPGIDAGDPAFDGTGRTDLAGNPRVIAATAASCPVARIDVGAYEFAPSSPFSCAQPPAVAPAKPVVRFAKTSAKFKFKKRSKLRNGFAVSAKKPKGGYFKVTSDTAGASFTLKLTNAKGKKLKGSQSLKLPIGTSYVAFRGKWNKKTLPAGRYKGSITSSNSMPSRISMTVATG